MSNFAFLQTGSKPGIFNSTDVNELVEVLSRIRACAVA